MRHTCARVLVVVAFAGLLSSPANPALSTVAHADSSGRERGRSVDTKGPDRISPRPLAEYKGLTPSEWLAVWWQEVFSTAVEAGSHPLIDGGAFGGKNGLVFLGGPVTSVGTPKVTIRATLPAGTHLFFPIITAECSEAEPYPFNGDDEAQLRTCANGLLDEVAELDVKIDGRPVRNPGAYRVDSPHRAYVSVLLVKSLTGSDVTSIVDRIAPT